MILLVLLVLLLPLLISYYFKKKKRYEELWKYLDVIPEPKSYPILGTNYKIHTRESLFVRERLRAIDLFPIYKLWSFDIAAVIVMHPEDVELVVNNSKHNDKSLIYSFLHDWLGTGLLTSGGTKWNKRRKILTPAFHFNILQEFVGMLNKETQILVDNLMKLSDAPHIDVTKSITEFTLYSIGETSLGVSLREDPNCKRYKQAVYDFGEYFAYRLVRPWLYIPLIYRLSSVYKKTKNTINILHDFSTNVINERKKTFVPNDNLSYSDRKRLALLDLMLRAKHDGADIDDEGIREELDTFIFEGHDTTACSIGFTLMALANEPKIQDKDLHF
ncbi:cytochrome P450 4C1-like [Diabrotica virgifera virgifera]|uniref:Cytochrome P450 4C1-like n=1 Tax=Diabrotica virgifera virgifera TaxID=50390 RepID=A0ABM5JY48_DIAVI|nr:cytochrome P450 4C1-like [Diabrotica virgifera virgifera]